MDKIAESLEKRGLWRRAATRWLEVMSRSKNDDVLNSLRARRNRCLARCKQSDQKNQEMIALQEPHSAAKLTLEKMAKGCD